MANDHPLFIYRYMDRSAPRRESARFRVRLHAAFPTNQHHSSQIWRSLRADAGISVRVAATGYIYWEDFFTQAPMDDVLTAITVTYRCLVASAGYLGAKYLADVSRAMADESMGFRVDEDGIVHFAVDEVFEGMRTACLAVLNAPALEVARGLYESAFAYLDQRPSDTKAAVRAMFEALEVVCRQLQPGAQNLHANLCRVNLRDQYFAVVAPDAVEGRVWAGMFEGMADWVQAMHQYRHGQVDGLAPPSEEFAVYALSSGSSYLRLIASLAVRVGVQPAVR